ncbi:DsbA-like protein [Necator americanus]|uniref:Glutathione S-transferase kappa 1 n=1 Tax=Necator americanus TaxID=51031 RepID=W2TAA7_NECAM|nr:DsbA-like protein [Necator americanus]ETN78529.1 DsbA-like protein [Necator americanus]
MADPSEKFQIDLYYDVISPYAWIAFESLLRYEYVWPIKVNLKPFSLRRIMQSSGNKPPSLVPAKSLYMLKDLERNNAFWDVKLNAPKVNFMQWIKAKTSEDAMKLLLVIQKEKPKKLEGVSREFWKRIWTNGEPIFEREDFEKVLVASSITDTARYIDKISDLTIETELQKNTLDAIDSGSLLRYENVWPIKVNLKPFSLRRIMQSSGNKPPGLIPAKSLYMLKDLERNNAFWNMKLKAPKKFMQWIKTKTSEDAMKLLLVIQKEKSEKLETVSREFWKRIWTNGEPIFEQKDFEKVLVASGITDTARYIDKISDVTIETELQKNTLDAIDSGAFGAPWIIVHKDGEEHAFFGSDRLHLIGHLFKERFHGGLKHFAKL